MLRKIFISIFLIALIGIIAAYYLWNKPHEAIGKPNFTTTSESLVKEFNDHEEDAAKKYIGTNREPIVTELTGIVLELQSDTTGIIINLDTGDPLNGISCVLDKFTPQVKTNFQKGDKIHLKGFVTGKLTDIIVDRCVILE